MSSSFRLPGLPSFVDLWIEFFIQMFASLPQGSPNTNADSVLFSSWRKQQIRFARRTYASSFTWFTRFSTRWPYFSVFSDTISGFFFYRFDEGTNGKPPSPKNTSLTELGTLSSKMIFVETILIYLFFVHSTGRAWRCGTRCAIAWRRTRRSAPTTTSRYVPLKEIYLFMYLFILRNPFEPKDTASFVWK